MKPQKVEPSPQMELFKVELKRLIDPAHPLVKLANRMDWVAFDNRFEAYFPDEGCPAIER